MRAHLYARYRKTHRQRQRPAAPQGGPEQLLRFDLPPEAGFLLSMLDGRTRIEELMTVSALDALEVLHLLARLETAGIVEVVRVIGAERTLLSFLDAPVVIGDPDGCAVYANPAFELRFERAVGRVPGAQLAELFEGGAREAVLRAVVVACTQGESVRFRLREGSVGFSAVASPIEAQGEQVGVVILLKEEVEGLERVLALHREMERPLDELSQSIQQLSEQPGRPARRAPALAARRRAAGARPAAQGRRRGARRAHRRGRPAGGREGGGPGRGAQLRAGCAAASRRGARRTRALRIGAADRRGRGAPGCRACPETRAGSRRCSRAWSRRGSPAARRSIGSC